MKYKNESYVKLFLLNKRINRRELLPSTHQHTEQRCSTYVLPLSLFIITYYSIILSSFHLQLYKAFSILPVQSTPDIKYSIKTLNTTQILCSFMFNFPSTIRSVHRQTEQFPTNLNIGGAQPKGAPPLHYTGCSYSQP